MTARRIAVALAGALLCLGPAAAGQDDASAADPTDVEDVETDADAEPLWVPPVDPDPDRIRRDFEIDYAWGRHERAALRAKWYWEHALEHSRSQSGVRLSFFLSDWFEFAQDHPPARETIRAARAKAARSVFEGVDVVRNFRDAVNLNEHLGEDASSVLLFRSAVKQYPELSTRFALAIDDILLELGEYELWSEHTLLHHATYGAVSSAPTEPCDHESHMKSSWCDVLRARTSAAEDSARILAALYDLGRRAEASTFEAELQDLQLLDEHPELFEEARRGLAPAPDGYPKLQPWTQDVPDAVSR